MRWQREKLVVRVLVVVLVVVLLVLGGRDVHRVAVLVFLRHFSV